MPKVSAFHQLRNIFAFNYSILQLTRIAISFCETGPNVAHTFQIKNNTCYTIYYLQMIQQRHNQWTLNACTHVQWWWPCTVSPINVGTTQIQSQLLINNNGLLKYIKTKIRYVKQLTRPVTLATTKHIQFIKNRFLSI